MTQVMQFVETLPPEEVARANFYALLARLFYAAPDAALLDAIAAAGEIEAEDGGIAAAWQGLARAATAADPEAVRDEYDTAFVGTGKAPVTLYACAYCAASWRRSVWNAGRTPRSPRITSPPCATPCAT